MSESVEMADPHRPSQLSSAATACGTVPGVTWPDPVRQQAFESWLAPLVGRFGLQPSTLRLASADASFRRYLRVDCSAAAAGEGDAASTRIVMDAPPPLEDVRPYLHVGGLLATAGVHVPRVLAADAAQGFLLLEDFGHQPWLPVLQQADAPEADRLMREAIAALVQMQRHADATSLPPYDAALLERELALFPDWCVQREYGVAWSAEEHATWQRVCRALVDSALAQPTVFVHRDWMPRNWMLTTPNPGVLDFQDAVRGPITYDIASMLRDAFLSWPEPQEIDWAVRYWQAARAAGLPVDEDFGAFWRSLEWMGLQRHLKILGIFCRLKHRDGKPKYAEDLPRFFDYATRVAVRYRPLQPLVGLMERLVGPLTRDGFSLR